MYKTASKNIQREVNKHTKISVPEPRQSSKRFKKKKLKKKSENINVSPNMVSSEHVYRAVNNGPEGAVVVLKKTGEVVLGTTIKNRDSWDKLLILVHLLNVRSPNKLGRVVAQMRKCGERAEILGRENL